MNRRSITSAIKEIKKRELSVGKERDKLCDLIDELSELKECCDRAYDALAEAREALSELV